MRVSGLNAACANRFRASHRKAAAAACPSFRNFLSDAALLTQRLAERFAFIRAAAGE
jgi:hypothetical protein